MCSFPSIDFKAATRGRKTAIGRDGIQRIFVDLFYERLCCVKRVRYCANGLNQSSQFSLKSMSLKIFNDSGQSGFVIRLFYFAVPYINCHFYTT